MKTETLKLKSALENLRPVIGRRNTLPILSCVKLHTERNRLNISASNLDEFAVERVEVDGEIDPVCVSFNFLSLALSGKEVEIQNKGKTIIVKCGMDETSISTLDAEEFPAYPKFEKPENHGAACAELSESINQVAWASSCDPARYVLNSALVSCADKSMSVVATNGRELATISKPLIGTPFEMLIPSEFLSNFASSLSRPGAILSSNKAQVRVSHDWGNYFCKQVDGTYPNYKQWTSLKTKQLGTVSTDEFKTIISGCCGFSQDSEAKGIFTFSKTGLLIDFTGDNGAKLSRHLAGKFSELKIALSTKKLLKIFQNIKTDDAKLSFVDELSPLVIESGDLMVITMPMRME